MNPVCRKWRLQEVYKRGLRRQPFRNLPVPKFEKRLDVVILGQVNVGKSVLLNTLIDTKLAATSRKRNTTRMEILGVFNHRNVQLAFFDTPGFIKRSNELKEDINRMSDTAALTVLKADVVLLVVDAALPITDAFKDSFVEMVKLGLRHAKIEIILVLNKVDLVEPKPELLDTTYELVSLINGVKLGPDKIDQAALDTTTFMISALKDDGVIDLKNYLISIAVTKPWLLTADDGVTALNENERVEQIVLENLLDNTHEEIPYIATIKCKSISRLTKGTLRIDVNIEVDTPSQQRIVVGQQGRTLVKVRQSSVDTLEKIMKKTIILYLWVNLRNQSGKNDYKASRRHDQDGVN